MAMPDFNKLAEKINVEFNDINILKRACTHRSYLNENKKAGLEHNERLEFLGDAVLELVVTSFLFRRYPDNNEGDLTSYRSALVNTNSLAKVALHIGVDEYLLLSKGESKDTGRARSIIHADSIEAIIGAVYIDKGYDSAANFISSNLMEILDIDEIIKNKTWLDSKSRFQEKAQEMTGQTPSYKTMKEAGPDHSKMFTLAVFIGDVQVALGQGLSKQEAEQKAAEKALEVKGW
jgi:ribonuclease-3